MEDDLDLIDDFLIGGRDDDFEVMVAETLPDSRDVVHVVDDPGGRRVEVVFLVSVDVEVLEEIVDVEVSFDKISLIVKFLVVLDDFVVFVVNLSDEFFEDVLHRDDAFRSPVFVDDDSHVGFGRLQLSEQSADLDVRRGVDALLQDLFYRSTGIRVIEEIEVLLMKNLLLRSFVKRIC